VAKAISSKTKKAAASIAASTGGEKHQHISGETQRLTSMASAGKRTVTRDLAT